MFSTEFQTKLLALSRERLFHCPMEYCSKRKCGISIRQCLFRHSELVQSNLRHKTLYYMLFDWSAAFWMKNHNLFMQTPLMHRHTIYTYTYNILHEMETNCVLFWYSNGFDDNLLVKMNLEAQNMLHYWDMQRNSLATSVFKWICRKNSRESLMTTP